MMEYASLGWASCPGARPLANGARACSCDRVGCPDVGNHPISRAWQMQATTDTALLAHWWRNEPEANIVLPTGRVFDVFDVPAAAGLAALATTDAAGTASGPVAVNGDRVLSMWPPATPPPTRTSGGRAPSTTAPRPSRRCPACAGTAGTASSSPRPPSWRPVSPPRGCAPDGRPLPDPLRVLDILADVCE
nr:bifunctional DNA primase/polymerase [Planobispora longispora]